MSSIAGIATLTGVLSAGQVAKNISLQDKTVVLSSQQQVIEADAGYDGLGEVTVPGVPASEDNLPAVMFGTNTTPTIASPDASHKTFKGINGITSITLSDATIIGENAFYKAANLTNVSAPEVTNVHMNAFYNCGNLDSVSLPKCTVVESYAFYGAFNSSYDVSLTLPECLTVNSSAFANAKLKTLILPKATTIDSNAISDSLIETITLSAATELEDGALSRAHNLTTVNIPECVTLGDGVFYECGFSSINLPKVETMGRELFSGNGYLRDVYLGYNGVVAVNKGEYNEYNMFGWDLQGETVTIHVPAAQLANYQSNETWSTIVAEAAENNITVAFAGDYSAQ